MQNVNCTRVIWEQRWNWATQGKFLSERRCPATLTRIFISFVVLQRHRSCQIGATFRFRDEETSCLCVTFTSPRESIGYFQSTEQMFNRLSGKRRRCSLSPASHLSSSCRGEFLKTPDPHFTQLMIIWNTSWHVIWISLSVWFFPFDLPR